MSLKLFYTKLYQCVNNEKENFHLIFIIKFDLSYDSKLFTSYPRQAVKSITDMSNPFKKISTVSKETAKKYASEKNDSEVITQKCPQCGAPRPVNTNIAFCSYCRFQFMNIDVTIKRENNNEPT